jgi:hypothetical protein
MIDLGATRNFISPAETQRIDIKIVRKKEQDTYKLFIINRLRAL